MGIMESSNCPRDELYDLVRRCWVEDLPEERIRQNLIKKMVTQLGYPLSLLAVEKELAQLPHLKLIEKRKIPKRRVDILVFAKEIHEEFSLFPLLMIECKVAPLTPKLAQQVIGYNAFVQAPYLALANEKSILTGHFDAREGHFKFSEGLPAYTSLINRIAN